MNGNENTIQPTETGLIPAVERPERNSKGIAVEPREFENLLQRAMEILTARAERVTPQRS
jgi:hypothetical protein